MFIGRIQEIKQLREQLDRDESRLVVVYGRRRVGKTALVDKAFENETVWKFEGVEGQSNQKQIKHFLFTMRLYLDPNVADTIPSQVKTWQEAFVLLNRHLPQKRIVVFFDEFQWMAGLRSTAVPIFKWAWDNLFSKRKNCCFILCGSISSFMVRRVIKSTALYGRIHAEIHLKPLSITESSQFLRTNSAAVERIETYMILGGVPYYLKELSHEQSLAQNLQKLALTVNGFFFGEYQRLFISHFAKHPHYELLMRSIAHSPHQTYEQVAHSLKIKTGGTISRIIEDLSLAGFIEHYVPVDKEPRSRMIRIRMSDEFLHFYYTFVEKNRNAIEDGSVHAFELLTGPYYAQWCGYAFERLCRKHANRIASALGFGGIRYRHGSWFRTRNGNGAQIDLLFIRADKILTVCEIKWTMPSNIAAVADDMVKKQAILKQFFTMPVQTVLIVGQKPTVDKNASSFFDAVLYAEEIFFQKE